MINNFVITINYNYLYSINNRFWLYNFPDLWILIQNKMENRLINVNDIYCMLSAKLHEQVGKERVYLTYISILLYIIKRNHDRNSSRIRILNQKLMQKQWKDASYMLSLHGFCSLLSYRAQGHQPWDVAEGHLFVSWPSRL